jgi:hypothetical protein
VSKYQAKPPSPFAPEEKYICSLVIALYQGIPVQINVILFFHFLLGKLNVIRGQQTSQLHDGHFCEFLFLHLEKKCE